MQIPASGGIVLEGLWTRVSLTGANHVARLEISVRDIFLFFIFHKIVE